MDINLTVDEVIFISLIIFASFQFSKNKNTVCKFHPFTLNHHHHHHKNRVGCTTLHFITHANSTHPNTLSFSCCMIFLNSSFLSRPIQQPNPCFIHKNTKILRINKDVPCTKYTSPLSSWNWNTDSKISMQICQKHENSSIFYWFQVFTNHQNKSSKSFYEFDFLCVTFFSLCVSITHIFNTKYLSKDLFRYEL